MSFNSVNNFGQTNTPLPFKTAHLDVWNHSKYLKILMPNVPKVSTHNFTKLKPPNGLF